MCTGIKSARIQKIQNWICSSYFWFNLCQNDHCWPNFFVRLSRLKSSLKGILSHGKSNKLYRCNQNMLQGARGLSGCSANHTDFPHRHWKEGRHCIIIITLSFLSLVDISFFRTFLNRKILAMTLTCYRVNFEQFCERIEEVLNSELHTLQVSVINKNNFFCMWLKYE